MIAVSSAIPLPACAARAAAIVSDRWLNSRPLGAPDLEGKVVLVEFWTFGCLNCIRTIPAMQTLHASYPTSEVVLVGVHSPEFARERDARNLEQAIERRGARYAVAIDNDFKNWRAYHNHYWPALYVVDHHGVIRHRQVGELHQGTPAWDELLGWIERLRKEPA
jgi:thiol-disulfide isomerase/thioredoxin